MKKKPKETRRIECNFYNFVCPSSKIKATEVIDNLDAGETAKTILSELFEDIVISVNEEGVYPEQLAKPVEGGDALSIVLIIGDE